MAITAATRTDIIELVVLATGGAPGVTLLGDLVTEFESTNSLASVATKLTSSASFKATYPAFATPSEFANEFLDNILPGLDAAVKAEGVAAIEAVLNGGGTKADVILQASAFLGDLSTSDAAFGASAALFQNQVSVATYHTVTLELDTGLTDALTGVSSDAATVTAKETELGASTPSGAAAAASAAAATAYSEAYDTAVAKIAAAAADTQNITDTIAAYEAAAAAAAETDAAALKTVSDEAAAAASAAADAKTAADQAVADAQAALNTAIASGDATAVSTANGTLIIKQSEAATADTNATTTAATAADALAAYEAAAAADAALATASTALTDLATATASSGVGAAANDAVAAAQAAAAAYATAAAATTADSADDAASAAAVTAAEALAASTDLTAYNAAATSLATIAAQPALDTAAAEALSAYNTAASAAAAALTAANDAKTALDAAATAANASTASITDVNAYVSAAETAVSTAATAKTAADAELAASQALSAATAATTSTADDAGAATAATTAATRVSDASALVTASAGSVDTAKALLPNFEAQSFTLTTNVDNKTTGAGDDTFTANTSAGALTLTSLDYIDGGNGNDTLTATVTAAVDLTAAVGATIKNIETIQVTSNNTVKVNSTDYTGLTKLQTTSVGNSTLTAATTTDIVAAVGSPTGTGAAAIEGGKDITLTVTDAAVLGTASGNTVVIGASTAAKGAVTVTYVESITDDTTAGIDTSTTGSITTNGGTSVNITSNANVAAADNAGDIATIGTITVNGKGTTTDVTVTQTAATIARNGTTQPNAKVTNGVVDINDYNTASKADTIKTASVTYFGNSTFTGNVLENLTLTGGSSSTVASGTFAINQSGGITTAGSIPTTLNLTASGHMGAITDTNDQYKTLNITTGSAATIADLDFTSVTALTQSGSAKLTVSALTSLAAAAVITASEGGMTITPALGTGQQFVGGAGKDSISIANTTVAINTGDGDDSVTVGASAVTANVDAGAGEDTLTMTATNAATASGSTTFEGKISGFEKASFTTTTNNTINMANLDDIADVTLDAANGATLSGTASGFKVSLPNGAAGSLTVTQTSGSGTADELNVAISNSAAKTVATLVASTFETLNFLTDDSATTPTGIAHVVTTLTDADVKTINVSGDAGLTITSATGTKLTSFDATGVTKGAVTVTTGALTAAATLKGGAGNDSLTATNATKAITVEGGAGNDTIVGASGQVNTVDGGAGNDTITGGSKADVLDGGAGTDIFVANLTEQVGSGTTDGTVVNLGTTALVASDVYTYTGKTLSDAATSVAAGTATYVFSNESSTNVVVVDTLSNFEGVTGTSGRDWIVGNSSNGTFDGQGGADYITGGGGVDTFVQDAGDSVVLSAETVTEAAIATSETITFGNGVDVISDFTAGTGGDKLDVQVAGLPTAGLGSDQTGNTSGTMYYLSGNFVQSTGVFTITANGSGSDTLIFEGDAGANLAAVNDAVVLVGVDSDDIVAANFI